jgi:hypothetical protein
MSLFSLMKVNLYSYDFEETYDLFLRLNPHELPSGLIGEERLRGITRLNYRGRAMYWWYQSLVDSEYRKFESNAR